MSVSFAEERREAFEDAGVITKEPDNSTKESHKSTEEPHKCRALSQKWREAFEDAGITAKELHKSTKEPHKSTKEPYKFTFVKRATYIISRTLHFRDAAMVHMLTNQPYTVLSYKKTLHIYIFEKSRLYQQQHSALEPSQKRRAWPKQVHLRALYIRKRVCQSPRKREIRWTDY